MVGKSQSSLYKDVVFALASVAVILTVGFFFWFPEILNIGFFEPEKSVIPVALWKVFLHIWLPAVIFCFVVGEMTGNLSQVDKLWSIIPSVFSWYITCIEGEFIIQKMHPKSMLISTLITIWTLKLTYGFYRRGGYTLRFWEGEEDYRWVYVRDRLPILKNNRILMMLFNLGFISIYQIFLIFSFSGGVVLGSIMARNQNVNISNHSSSVLHTSDIVIAVWILCVIAIESTADIQQQLFQKEKYKRITKKLSLECPVEHYELGFCTTGLFGYSRHPNFTCEQLLWLSFYLFTIDFKYPLKMLGVGGVFNISITGPFLLIVLFKVSTDLTEDISREKYPRYKDYQKHVGRLLDLGNVVRRIFLCQGPKQSWIVKQ